MASTKKILIVVSFSVWGLSLCPLKSYVTEVINLVTCAKILNTQDHSFGAVRVTPRWNSCLVHILSPKNTFFPLFSQQFPSCLLSPHHWIGHSPVKEPPAALIPRRKFLSHLLLPLIRKWINGDWHSPLEVVGFRYAAKTNLLDPGTV